MSWGQGFAIWVWGQNISQVCRRREWPQQVGVAADWSSSGVETRVAVGRCGGMSGAPCWLGVRGWLSAAMQARSNGQEKGRCPRKWGTEQRRGRRGCWHSQRSRLGVCVL